MELWLPDPQWSGATSQPVRLGLALGGPIMAGGLSGSFQGPARKLAYRCEPEFSAVGQARRVIVGRVAGAMACGAQAASGRSTAISGRRPTDESPEIALGPLSIGRSLGPYGKAACRGDARSVRRRGPAQCIAWRVRISMTAAERSRALHVHAGQRQRAGRALGPDEDRARQVGAAADRLGVRGDEPAVAVHPRRQLGGQVDRLRHLERRIRHGTPSRPRPPPP